VRLVVDKVTVRDHHVTIYFKIPIEISPRRPSAPAPQPTSGKPVSTQFALRSTHVQSVFVVQATQD
jgi:hypothetical protein